MSAPVNAPTTEQRLSSFAGLSPEQIAVLARAFTTRDLQPGEALLTEGVASEALFLLHRGELDVSVGDAAASVELGQIPEGVVFGEVSFIDDGPATATVKARTPATVLSLSRASLASLRCDHPRIATAILRTAATSLATRVRLASDRLDKLTLGDAASEAPRTGFLGALRSLFGTGKAG
ncbi:MAG: cyclic nucleotide-binding domain-containing protein [Polyangiales bacterium]